MPNMIGLKCISCEREFSPEIIDYTCPNCGPLLGTLEVVYDFPAVKKILTREKLAQNRNMSQWRYLPILPINDPDKIQPLSVGWTPMYRSPSLENSLNLQRIWIKDDTRNPSGSLKDRASAIAVTRALEKGHKTVTAASSGNAAASLAAFGTLADLDTFIFVGNNTPKGKIAQLLLYGATVFKVNDSYDAAFDLCCQAAEKWGWYNRSTAINPYLGEGKKTAALEVCEQLDWQVPDYLFVSVGDACIFQGMWKGFKDFYEIGLIDRLPKMIAVQGEHSAPLVHAWETGAAQCEPLDAKTIADSICVGIPRDQIKALKAVRESGGRFISVTDGEMLSAISILARKAGILAEPGGAAPLAGLQKMASEGLCTDQDTAVVMVTGHGLKDIEGVLKAVDQKEILVENRLDEIASVINSG